jgi:hypothetical protein
MKREEVVIRIIKEFAESPYYESPEA